MVAGDASRQRPNKEPVDGAASRTKPNKGPLSTDGVIATTVDIPFLFTSALLLPMEIPPHGGGGVPILFLWGRGRPYVEEPIRNPGRPHLEGVLEQHPTLGDGSSGAAEFDCVHEHVQH
jgi:hypothetical protein